MYIQRSTLVSISNHSQLMNLFRLCPKMGIIENNRNRASFRNRLFHLDCQIKTGRITSFSRLKINQQICRIGIGTNIYRFAICRAFVSVESFSNKNHMGGKRKFITFASRNGSWHFYRAQICTICASNGNLAVNIVTIIFILAAIIVHLERGHVFWHTDVSRSTCRYLHIEIIDRRELRCNSHRICRHGERDYLFCNIGIPMDILVQGNCISIFILDRNAIEQIAIFSGCC